MAKPSTSRKKETKAMPTLKKLSKKLLLTAIMAIVAMLSVVGTTPVEANELIVIATFSNGNYIGLSCGGSSGNFRYIYYANTNTYLFYAAEPDDCAPPQ
jgi:hypothetical protein